jgi:hypothetical protein
MQALEDIINGGHHVADQQAAGEADWFEGS